jgi:hypothetical protein
LEIVFFAGYCLKAELPCIENHFWGIGISVIFGGLKYDSAFS